MAPTAVGDLAAGLPVCISARAAAASGGVVFLVSFEARRHMNTAMTSTHDPNRIRAIRLIELWAKPR